MTKVIIGSKNGLADRTNNKPLPDASPGHNELTMRINSNMFLKGYAIKSFQWAGSCVIDMFANYINPGYGLSLVDTLWNASSYRQPLEQEGNPMT